MAPSATKKVVKLVLATFPMRLWVTTIDLDGFGVESSLIWNALVRGADQLRDASCYSQRHGEVEVVSRRGPSGNYALYLAEGNDVGDEGLVAHMVSRFDQSREANGEFSIATAVSRVKSALFAEAATPAHRAYDMLEALNGFGWCGRLEWCVRSPTAVVATRVDDSGLSVRIAVKDGSCTLFINDERFDSVPLPSVDLHRIGETTGAALAAADECGERRCSGISSGAYGDKLREEFPLQSTETRSLIHMRGASVLGKGEQIVGGTAPGVGEPGSFLVCRSMVPAHGVEGAEGVEKFVIRRSDCSVLAQAPGERCRTCKARSKRVYERDRKCERQNTSVPHVKTPHKVLSRAQLVKLLRDAQRRLGKLTGARLREEQAVDVTRAENAELQEVLHRGASLLPEDCPELAAVLQDQFRHSKHTAAKKNARSFRWSAVSIKMAVALANATGMKGLKVFREITGLRLPSERRVQELRNYGERPEGCVQSFVDRVGVVLQHRIEAESKRLGRVFTEAEKCGCVLMSDEIHINRGLYFDKRTQKLVGAENIGDLQNKQRLNKLCEALNAEVRACSDEGGDDDAIAEAGDVVRDAVKSVTSTTLMVWYVRSTCVRFFAPVACYSMASCDKQRVMQNLDAVLQALSYANLEPWLWVCDAASSNISAVTRKLEAAGNNNLKRDGYFKEPWFVNENADYLPRCYWSPCTIHAVKRGRNVLLDRPHLRFGGLDINIADAETAVEYYRPCVLSPVPKLRPGHFQVNSFDRMRVPLAVQVLSGSLAGAMVLYAADLQREAAAAAAESAATADVDAAAAGDAALPYEDGSGGYVCDMLDEVREHTVTELPPLDRSLETSEYEKYPEAAVAAAQTPEEDEAQVRQAGKFAALARYLLAFDRYHRIFNSYRRLSSLSNDADVAHLDAIDSWLEEWWRETRKPEPVPGQKRKRGEVGDDGIAPANRCVGKELYRDIRTSIASLRGAVQYYVLQEKKMRHVVPMHFNQDPLERFFSYLRSHGGGVRNPTAEAAITAVRQRLTMLEQRFLISATCVAVPSARARPWQKRKKTEL